MKILHIINSLESGGTERAVSVLTKQLAAKGASQIVLCIKGKGPFADIIASSGILVLSLNFSSTWQLIVNIPNFFNIILTLIKFNPNIIQSYLYHSDIFSILLGRTVLRKAKVYWGLRNSEMNFNKCGRSTKLAFKIARNLSKLPAGIISNSNSGVDVHIKLGYSSNQDYFVVPNGFDPKIFYPAQKERTEIRSQLKILDDEILVGYIGRHNYIKGPDLFIETAHLILQEFTKVRFIMIGSISSPGLEKVKKENATVVDRMYLIGETKNVNGYLNAIDLLICPSRSEGLANIWGEAILAETAIISTKVGDAVLVLTDSFVSKTNDSLGLFQLFKITHLMDSAELKLKISALKQNILDNFSVEKLGESYLKIYKS